MNIGTPEAFLALAVFLGGFISGVSGFAFSAVAGAIILHFYPPGYAIPLMMACASGAQLYGLLRLWNSMLWRESLFLILGGMLGIPLGLFALRSVDAHSFRIFFGVFLSLYAAYMLFWSSSVTERDFGGSGTRTVIGFISGVIGGLTAFPGAVPTVWCDMRGLSKAARRGLTQPFIAAMQFYGFFMAILNGALTPDLAWDIGWSLVPLMIGTYFGVMTFGKVNDLLFRRIVLSALMVSGVALL